MKISDAKVSVCGPGRNFVTLKIQTDEGVYGLGDATLNGVNLPWLPIFRTTSFRA
jgi:mannonate dehydratase